MDRRLVMHRLALVRLAVGAVLLLAPGLAVLLLGHEARRPVARLLVRALGVRDLALGVGLLRASELGHDDQGWLLLGAASDAVDALGTLAAFGHLPRRRRWLVLGSAAGSVATAVAIANLEPPPAP